ncbi:MAG: tetratricopeptide repeat protein [Enhygromyxa sp.]
MPLPRPILLASTLGLALFTTACGDISKPKDVQALSDNKPKPKPEPPEPAEAVAALERSIELEAQGQLDAAVEAARAAVAAGGQRSAKLQGAKLAILTESYDEAEALLTELIEADANDADAHYNLGLVAHHHNRYNKARSSYLAALRAREDYPEARYNLAVLTWRRNVVEEARHHVERFAERWPNDPRTPELVAMLSGNPPGPNAKPVEDSGAPQAP